MGDDEFFKALKREIQKPPKSASVGIVPEHNSDTDDLVGVVGADEISDFLDGYGESEPVTVKEEVIWTPALPTELPPIKADIVAGPIPLTLQQKNNICVIAYSLATRNRAVEPPEIYKLWPIEGDPYKLQRAGKRPSITGIQQFIATEDFSQRMSERGIEIAPVTHLMPEQIALISILSNSVDRSSTSARLKRAGITWAIYNGWRRQKPFADALQEAQGGVLQDAIGNSDTQLAQMAQNGDLKAIIYMNDLIGRGPNNRKAVDAIQFARIVLEAVQKNVNPAQARAISAEIELASKQLGIGA